MNALIAHAMRGQLDAFPHRVTVRLVIMKTWQILDAYHVHGLAFTVGHCTRCFRRRLGVNSKVARKMALVQVRTVLSHSIDNGSFYHG